MTSAVKYFYTFLILLLLTVGPLKAQNIWERPEDLKKEIMRMDSILFTAFNNCDLTTMRKLHAENLEFYHDLIGVINGRESFIESLESGVCSANANVKRTLIKETFQVYPIKNVGAIQMNDHKFDIVDVKTGKKFTSIAKSIAIWRFNDGQWEITRTVSYDHKVTEHN